MVDPATSASGIQSAAITSSPPPPQNYMDIQFLGRDIGQLATANIDIGQATQQQANSQLSPVQQGELAWVIEQETSWTTQVADFTAQFSSGAMALDAIQPAVAELGRKAGLDQTTWGASLQQILDTPGLATSFTAGLQEGMLNGAKDMVVGIASLAGRAVQYGADVGLAGDVGDFVRNTAKSALPETVQGWLRTSSVGQAMNAVLPSDRRGDVSTAALQDMGNAAKNYFASHSASQIADDVGNAIDKAWDGLEADHAKAVAQGPQAEARWWGETVGRVTFEVAATFVPVAGVAGKASKGAQVIDGTADAVRILDAAGDSVRATDKTGDIVRAGDALTDTARAADNLDEAALAARATQLTQQSAKVGKNSVEWTLDGAGRPVEAHATLREVFVKAPRSSAEKAAQVEVGGAARLATDQGGHVIGHRFVKDQGLKNLFPQNANLNNSGFKKVENEMADWITAGGEVSVDIKLKDIVDGRPGKIEIAYEVIDPKTGDVIFDNMKQFNNVAGETFDRVPSGQMQQYFE
ncbi:DNA/RNA non-specific endonuclease [Parasphingorhabdus cellanae]|uniref:DNA/RNA non-specific endonuclease n=1 Tax=Parasphingorhabdus cellanae TaxID=2806553 RepID=A0ABX7T3H5_9SPHN|nr:DNA/RNA non-specific endonuclease [Parasphingorhabdus cellanae]QTD56125.1 DNA/RNA non-specific endonuclease [Parasphingorhabdus cellanae]